MTIRNPAMTRARPSITRAASILLLAATSAWPAAAETEMFGLGTTATAGDIQRIDVDVMPDGRGLPTGSGSVAEGKAIYDAQCSQCHGAAGHGGPQGSLAGEPLYDPAQIAADRSLKRTVGNYWPYATTIFDYIRRAMPYDRPGSLADNEVYALTAYLLHANNLIDQSAVMDADTLPAVVMPARKYYVDADDTEAASRD